jgi:tripartite ATP-independent transporter DctM subunit
VDPVAAVVLVILLMLFLIALGMPIAFALGLTGSLGIVLLQDWATLLYTLGTFPVSRVSTYAWTVIPLFVLLGNLAEASGVAADAYSVAHKWLARVKGGLVLVTIGACGLIAATTGSGATGTAVMGKIAVPEMKRYGYDMKLATGAAASAGTVGILIPPSGSFAIIGVLAELSIGKLFVAGIMPGILSVLIYMAMVYIRCIFNPELAPLAKGSTWKEKLLSLGKAWGVLVIFVSVMGGLYTGVATAIEVAALGSFVALIMVFIAIARGKSNWGMLKDAVVETIRLCAMIFAFIFAAGIFSLFITLSGVLDQAIVFFAELSIPRTLILAGIISIYIPLGMFFDPLSMVIVTVPIAFPIVVRGLGYDPIWYSVITVKLVELSVITPPVGLNLYVMKGVFPEVSIDDIIRGCGWFMVMDMLTIAILIAFPSISTWLPSLMKG